MAGIRLPLILSSLGILLCLFTILEVNYPRLAPQTALAVFATLGLVLCFLSHPVHRRAKGCLARKGLDLLLAALAVVCGAFIIFQTEPAFRGWWLGGQSLGNRAGQETALDFVVGVAGLLLILEATRRSLGLALPILAGVFFIYGLAGPIFPDWLFPHRGYPVERLVAQTYLHTQGVFGVALNVMFTYVFLFVVFGAFLQASGATHFIMDLAERLFRRGPGGPAKVAVLSSGLMGSLSGSAVANTATTGTFTIPLMRAAGFRREIAAGVEAAASSGGALVPPVMGAGAYMMLEIIDPPVSYLQIIRAALLPALLYYLSLFLIVHFYSRRLWKGGPPEPSSFEAEGLPPRKSAAGSPLAFEGLIFAGGLASLVLFLLVGYTPFRAASLSLLTIVALSSCHPRTRLTFRGAAEALAKSAQNVVPLICAAACVGIVIGVVTLTGIGTRLPALILPLAQDSLLAALFLIMVSSIVLGMGLPSAICYLLLATLMGPVLGDLGVVPLGAHLFIFYFGMMSMVTPPVALAAYAAASIAGASIMKSGLAAFRFALVGFTLPYIFVFRPQLLMLAPDGQRAPLGDILPALAIAVLGIVAFAAGIARYLFSSLGQGSRWLLLGSAALLLAPGKTVPLAGYTFPVQDLTGVVLLAAVALSNWMSSRARRK